MENKRFRFKDDDSVYVLTEVIRKTLGDDNGKAQAITNALYRDTKNGCKTLGEVKECLATDDGKNRLLKVMHFGPKRLETLEKVMNLIDIVEAPKPTESEPKRVHVAMDKHERGYYKASFHPAEPGWKYVGKVIGEVDILLNIPKGDGYEQKRVILTCNGAERTRCIFMEDALEEFVDHPSNHVGFVFRGYRYFEGAISIRDKHDATEYIYNSDNIVSIKNTRYKLYVRDTDNTEEVEDVH